MPIWDNEIIKFWTRVPIELRVNRKLYYEYVKIKQDENLPKSNIKRNKISRGLDRLNNPIYGRYLGGRGFLPFLLSTAIKDVLNTQGYDFIRGNRLVILTGINSLATIDHMNLLHGIECGLKFNEEEASKTKAD